MMNLGRSIWRVELSAIVRESMRMSSCRRRHLGSDGHGDVRRGGRESGTEACMQAGTWGRRLSSPGGSGTRRHWEPAPESFLSFSAWRAWERQQGPNICKIHPQSPRRVGSFYSRLKGRVWQLGARPKEKSFPSFPEDEAPKACQAVVLQLNPSVDPVYPGERSSSKSRLAQRAYIPSKTAHFLLSPPPTFNHHLSTPIRSRP
ncbi:uncharacterized protein BDZ83DRAFT_152849 [Colletotrichum acutatum]|uniref:Uncharacterized protein n=1 Tax=Glomerella acutata TaxID=27357 RepID=A0AAD8USU6_GLOAC|nr:uncharacterized protein BDZ83DRAFT_152849 [Colletotrichum acutatum]KAK1728182.1 hypothetical protein BDZ83DRAFT_152849 [Colletotrichum acutatum]